MPASRFIKCRIPTRETRAPNRARPSSAVFVTRSVNPTKSSQADRVHPDRAPNGEWIEYEEGNNPWERSKYSMCNMWHEWDGMQEVVAEEESKAAKRA